MPLRGTALTQTLDLMRTIMNTSRLVILLFSVTLVAPALFAGGGSFPIRGPYANRLSDVDVQQIKVLISKDSRVDHTLKRIEAAAADKVRIRIGGRTAIDSATYYDFIAYKRAGRWAIDAKSIEISIESIEQPNNGQILIR
jgi:hypothetical protein